jgi:hypothetical protein
MRTLLKALFLSCVLTGCIITQQNGLHLIINENLEVYEKYDQVEFTHVAAIFKTYANMVNGKEYNTTTELQDDTEKFLKQIKDSNISDNYPVKASKEEVYVASHFIKDVLKNIKKNDVRASRFQNHINQALKIYVVEIISHEEKIPE